MRSHIHATAVAICLAASAFAQGPIADRSNDVRSAISSGRAKNVILFLGDGMGDSEITIARNYHVGAAGRLNLDKLPLTGAYTTYSVQESDPTKPDYVPDSAATGTAWATGSKTSNGRISTTAGTDRDLITILELAQAAGYKTGNVSTAEITDATPAVLGAHVNSRGCQGPANMSACPQDKKANGGPGSIAEQLVDHKIDVILGGGKSRFTQVIDGGVFAGQTVLQSAVAQGYTNVFDAAALAGVSQGTRVLGLFNNGNMTQEWTGLPATPAGTGPQTCNESNRPSNEPSVADMTRKALELLDANLGSADKGNALGKKGFFLQVEGASIDKRDHAADPCGQIGETVAFDEAVKVGLEYAKSHPDTLIIVTADHAHTSQIIPNEAHPTGSLSRLNTADGAVMTVTWGTEPFGVSQEHTGSQVRIAAQGPQAANVVGITDQTELFHTMARALGLE